MSVTEDQMEISGMHLEEPVTVQRITAREQVKLRLLDMKIRGDDGRRYRLRYSKADPEKNLTLARLEAWLDPDFTDDPETANQFVDRRLKKWSCRMVTHWIAGLLVLQVIGLISVAIACVISMSNLQNDLPGEWEEGMIIAFVALGFVALLVGGNITFLVLLRFGQMWTLYFVMMFYSLFCLLSLVNVNPVGILIGGLLIYYSVKAKGDYKRLSPQIGGIVE